MKAKLTKKLRVLILAFSIFISNNCSNDTTIPVTKVYLDKTAIPSLAIGSTVQLTAIVLPDNATDKEVKWSTSDPIVATVDDNGLVTAKYGGEITIQAQAGAASASCKIVVAFPDIKIIPESTSMVVGDVQIAKVEGQGNSAITFHSSSPEVAGINEAGVITAKSAGKTKLSATSANNKIAYCDIEVTAEAVAVKIIKIENLSGINPSTYIKVPLVAEALLQLKTTVLPENATNKKLIYTSSDEAIATVDEDGYITPKAAGKITITITSAKVNNDGVATATCKIEVTPENIPVTGITVTSPLELNLFEGTRKIDATATSAAGTPSNTKLNYLCLSTTKATVDADGWVTPKAVGTTTIRITPQDGSAVTADCVVNITAVRNPVTSITVTSPLALNLLDGAGQIVASATSATGAPSNPKLLFRSLNTSTATVDADGWVTPKAVGSTTIKITPQDGSAVSADCVVNITVTKNPVTLITVNPSSFTLVKNAAAQMVVATVTPADATNSRLSYRSLNTTVASVDATTGWVTPKAAGSAKIIVEADDNSGVTAECTVIVTN